MVYYFVYYGLRCAILIKDIGIWYIKKIIKKIIVVRWMACDGMTVRLTPFWV